MGSRSIVTARSTVPASSLSSPSVARPPTTSATPSPPPPPPLLATTTPLPPLSPTTTPPPRAAGVARSRPPQAAAMGIGRPYAEATTAGAVGRPPHLDNGTNHVRPPLGTFKFQIPLQVAAEREMARLLIGDVEMAGGGSGGSRSVLKPIGGIGKKKNKVTVED